MDGYSRDVDGLAIAPGGTGPLDFNQISQTSHVGKLSNKTIQKKLKCCVFFVPATKPHN